MSAPGNWKPDFPPSSATVEVSVIDTTCYMGNTPASLLLQPSYPGYDMFKLPSYSFLIHHKPSDTRVLFDLGLRKNWQTHLGPPLLELISKFNLELHVEKDTAEILQENGISPADISAIIFSHHHWDHVGDTTLFPPSTSLVVGQGYKAKYLPGWPVDPNSTETTTDLYEGRETVEIQYTGKHCLKIGEFQAFDYFHDGSFYLLDAPGHTQGHLNALARTTLGADTGGQDTFVLLAGDSVHHGALFRPSKYYPLPDTISPAPYDDCHAAGSSCPGSVYAALHRAMKDTGDEHQARTTSLCIVPPDAADEDHHAAAQTVDKVTVIDGMEDVFTITAHDDTLLPLIDFFPKSVNSWKANGWKEKGHWRFLGPLQIKPL
jgi:glyoxylase-like metal-dependent hydrolase (beta-lactamase superfamily II)